MIFDQISIGQSLKIGKGGSTTLPVLHQRSPDGQAGSGGGSSVSSKSSVKSEILEISKNAIFNFEIIFLKISKIFDFYIF